MPSMIASLTLSAPPNPVRPSPSGRVIPSMPDFRASSSTETSDALSLIAVRCPTNPPPAGAEPNPAAVAIPVTVARLPRRRTSSALAADNSASIAADPSPLSEANRIRVLTSAGNVANVSALIVPEATARVRAAAVSSVLANDSKRSAAFFAESPNAEKVDVSTPTTPPTAAPTAVPMPGIAEPIAAPAMAPPPMPLIISPAGPPIVLAAPSKPPPSIAARPSPRNVDDSPAEEPRGTPSPGPDGVKKAEGGDAGNGGKDGCRGGREGCRGGSTLATVVPPGAALAGMMVGSTRTFTITSLARVIGLPLACCHYFRLSFFRLCIHLRFFFFPPLKAVPILKPQGTAPFQPVFTPPCRFRRRFFSLGFYGNVTLLVARMEVHVHEPKIVKLL